MKNLFDKQSENLAAAYQKTIYRCLEPLMELRVGEMNSEVDHFLIKGGHEMMCILTAYNPKSIIESLVVNQQCQAQLVRVIEKKGFDWMKGVNKDPEKKFPDEPACWILGMAWKEAFQLAERWGQNAYVFYRIGKRAELKWVNKQ